MFYHNSPYGDLETARSRREAQRENEARLAHSSAFWRTVGSGEMTAPKAFKFDVSFIEEPAFTYGTVIEDVDFPDYTLLPTELLIPGFYPRAFAGVYQWVRSVPPGDINDDDPNLVPYYVGAHVYFAIDLVGPLHLYDKYLELSLGQPVYTLRHNLKWEGKALKDLPAHLLDTLH